jgi:selenide, water dikinase
MGLNGRSGRVRVVLVGGGHTHVEVLRRWSQHPGEAQLTVVLDSPTALYSGMVPGYVAGDYRREDFSIDVAGLARRAGGEVILGEARLIDCEARLVHLAAGGTATRVTYDIASLNVGCVMKHLDVPGVRTHALPLRPIRLFLHALETRLSGLRWAPGAPPQIAVVGAGAAGVELAFALAARLTRAGREARVTLVHHGDPLGGYPPGTVERVLGAFAERGLQLCGGVTVSEVTAREVIFTDGSSCRADLVIWATGAAPPPLVIDSPSLPRDGRGFVTVRPTLEVAGQSGLFGAGDCVSIVGHPRLPKAGVYAVREAPILYANLRASLSERGLRTYSPQKRFLSLLSLGDGTAIASWGGLAVRGSVVGRIKDWNDRRWVHRFAPAG